MNGKHLNTLIVAIVSLSLVANVWTAKASCAAPEKYLPCTCIEFESDNSRGISCEGNITSDMAGIFKHIGDSLVDDYNYGIVILEKIDNVVELPAHVFGKFKFQAISISKLHQLERIHRDAFANTGAIILDIMFTPIVDAHAHSEYDLFAAVRAMSMLKVLTVARTNLTAFPPEAFQSHPTLTNIIISASPITSIGENAFINLTMLKELSFQKEQLAHIADGVFNVGDRPGQALTIDLWGNNLSKVHLNGSMFERVNDYVTLHLWFNGFEYMNEIVFRPFLLDRPHNMLYSATNCNHTGNEWLLKDFPNNWQCDK